MLSHAGGISEEVMRDSMVESRPWRIRYVKYPMQYFQKICNVFKIGLEDYRESKPNLGG
jgi:hypothetical protein